MCLFKGVGRQPSRSDMMKTQECDLPGGGRNKVVGPCLEDTNNVMQPGMGGGGADTRRMGEAVFQDDKAWSHDTLPEEDDDARSVAPRINTSQGAPSSFITEDARRVLRPTRSTSSKNRASRRGL
jgi:hypothetical protein